MEEEKPGNNKLTPGGWFVLLVLVAFLVVALIYAAQVWNTIPDTPMSGLTWVFIVLAVVISVALGVGLMALLFYSAKHDYDR